MGKGRREKGTSLAVGGGGGWFCLGVWLQRKTGQHQGREGQRDRECLRGMAARRYTHRNQRTK